LPDLHRQLLQHALHAGFHVELLDLIHFQLGEFLGLIDGGLL
jgi:hypothetical protein